MSEIVAAEIQSTRIAVRRPHQMAIGTTTVQENVVVKLVTDDGPVGAGEAPHMVGHSQKGETPGTVRVVLRDKLIPAVLGLSVMEHRGARAGDEPGVPATCGRRAR